MNEETIAKRRFASAKSRLGELAKVIAEASPTGMDTLGDLGVTELVVRVPGDKPLHRTWPKELSQENLQVSLMSGEYLLGDNREGLANGYTVVDLKNALPHLSTDVLERAFANSDLVVLGFSREPGKFSAKAATDKTGRLQVGSGTTQPPIPGLENDPVYQQLNPRIQQRVNEAIQRELKGIAEDRNLLEPQKEEYRQRYLEVKVPKFIQNMLDLQIGNQRYAAKIRRDEAEGKKRSR